MIGVELVEKIRIGKPFFAPQGFGKIFSWEELEVLLNVSPLISANRFNILDNKEHSWIPYTWSSDKNTWPVEVVRESIEKYTCYLGDASRANKNINQICSEIEAITGKPTDAHIYFNMSQENKIGFGIHNDKSDNLIVQCEGTSNIRVWDLIETEGRSRIDKLEYDPAFDVVMTPGDAIYIPKRYWHEVVSVSQRLSVSFPSFETTNPVFCNREWINVKTIAE